MNAIPIQIHLDEEDCHTDSNGNGYCGSFVEFYHRGDAVSLVHNLVHDNSDDTVSDMITAYVKEIWIGAILLAAIFLCVTVALGVWSMLLRRRRAKQQIGSSFKSFRGKMGIGLIAMTLVPAIVLACSTLACNWKTQEGIARIDVMLDDSAGILDEAIELQENATESLSGITSNLNEIGDILSSNRFAGTILGGILDMIASATSSSADALDGLSDDLIELDKLVEKYAVYYPDLILRGVNNYGLAPIMILWVLLLLVFIIHSNFLVRQVIASYQSETNRHDSTDCASVEDSLDRHLELIEERNEKNRCNLKQGISALFVLLIFLGGIGAAALELTTIAVADVCVTPDNLIYAAESNEILAYYINCDEGNIASRNPFQTYLDIVEYNIEETGNNFDLILGQITGGGPVTSLGENLRDLSDTTKDLAYLVSCENINGKYTTILKELCGDTHDNLALSYRLCVAACVFLVLFEIGHLLF